MKRHFILLLLLIVLLTLTVACSQVETPSSSQSAGWMDKLPAVSSQADVVSPKPDEALDPSILSGATVVDPFLTVSSGFYKKQKLFQEEEKEFISSLSIGKEGQISFLLWTTVEDSGYYKWYTSEGEKSPTPKEMFWDETIQKEVSPYTADYEQITIGEDGSIYLVAYIVEGDDVKDMAAYRVKPDRTVERLNPNRETGKDDFVSRISSTGKVLLNYLGSPASRCYDSQIGKEVCTIPGDRGVQVRGDVAVSGSLTGKDFTLSLYDLNTGACIQQNTLKGDDVNWGGIGVSLDEQNAYFFRVSGEVYAMNRETGEWSKLAEAGDTFWQNIRGLQEDGEGNLYCVSGKSLYKLTYQPG